MEKKVEINKMCSYCAHARLFGLHAVKIECDVDGKEMYGYTGKNEYRQNAKECSNFDCRRPEV